MHINIRSFFYGIFVACATLLTTQCKNKGVNVFGETAKLKVATTTTIVTDMVRRIGGDDVKVVGLMKAGVDPHSYEQTARDTAAVRQADVVIFSGLHLEAKMAEALEHLSEVKSVHAVTSTMPRERLVQPSEGNAAYADPHAWGDPALWAEGVDVVVKALSEKLPEKAAEFAARGEVYRQELLAVKAWAKQRVQEIPERSRVLVTSHDAFMYYAREFGFKVLPIDGLAPGDGAGAGRIQEIAREIQDAGVKVIFAETAANDKGIQALAKEAKVGLSKHLLFADATGEAGSIETVGGESYDLGTYVGMVKHNINAIVEGLK